MEAAAQAFRENPAFKTEDVISQLGVGHALISVLDETGVPGVVQNCSVLCPQSLMAPADESFRLSARSADGMGKYDVSVDNESAYEMLEEQRAAQAEADALAAERSALEAERAAFEKQKAKEEEAQRKKAEKEELARQKKVEKMLEREEAARQKAAERRRAKIESQLISAGGQILKRGLMGTLFGGSSRRR